MNKVIIGNIENNGISIVVDRIRKFDIECQYHNYPDEKFMIYNLIFSLDFRSKSKVELKEIKVNAIKDFKTIQSFIEWMENDSSFGKEDFIFDL